jgi:hypothetical protein
MTRPAGTETPRMFFSARDPESMLAIKGVGLFTRAQPSC